MNIQEIQKEIISEFKVFDDWLNNKYKHLIELGRKLPPIDPQYKTEEHLIKGCQVETWFHATFRDGKVFYDIDTNSLVIKGIIALLIRVLSGQKPEDIENADLYFIDQIGLRDNFSPTQENSLWKLVNQIKQSAIRAKRR